jgi:hypothetical protein
MPGLYQAAIQMAGHPILIQGPTYRQITAFALRSVQFQKHAAACDLQNKLKQPTRNSQLNGHHQLFITKVQHFKLPTQVHIKLLEDSSWHMCV